MQIMGARQLLKDAKEIYAAKKAELQRQRDAGEEARRLLLRLEDTTFSPGEQVSPLLSYVSPFFALSLYLFRPCFSPSLPIFRPSFSLSLSLSPGPRHVTQCLRRPSLPRGTRLGGRLFVRLRDFHNQMPNQMRVQIQID